LHNKFDHVGAERPETGTNEAAAEAKAPKLHSFASKGGEVQNKRLSQISLQNTSYRNSLAGVTKKTKIFASNRDLQASIKNKSDEYKLGHSDLNEQQLIAFA
jgi:hypothetical protein